MHHVAWNSADEDHEAWRDRVTEHGAHPTPVIDRHYFKSIYFREPSGVLFELATPSPGFTVDEPLETLGEKLSIPPQLEELRPQIEATVKPLENPRSAARPAQSGLERAPGRKFRRTPAFQANAPTCIVVLAVALSMLAFAAPTAFGQATEGDHSDNMEFVKNLPYERKNGATSNFGTDIEFATIGGRQYALGGLVPQRHADRGHHEPARRAESCRSTTAASPRATSRSSARPTSRAACSRATPRTPTATAPPPATGRPRRSASRC